MRLQLNMDCIYSKRQVNLLSAQNPPGMRAISERQILRLYAAETGAENIIRGYNIFPEYSD